MLSVNDIKNVSFRRSNFGGYKPEDVDAFIDDVQISYETLIREKESLLATIERLNEKIDKFHEEDNSIRSVILNAQKIAEKSLSEAKIKTGNMVNEALETSKKLINDAKKEVSFHTEISDKLKRESSRLRRELEDIYKKHFEIIKTIPNENPAENKLEEVSDKAGECASKSAEKIEIKNEPEDISSTTEIKISGGEDVFSSPEVVTPRKFKNLKFGKNFSETENEEEKKSKGAYFGIFKK